MTNKEMTIKNVELEELDNVSGGTVKEYDEIVRAVYERWGNDPDGIGADLRAHIPFFNLPCSDSIYYYLREKFGIRANIDLGFAGTGLGSDPNTYKDVVTGQPLTHEQVMARIRK